MGSFFRKVNKRLRHLARRNPIVFYGCILLTVLCVVAAIVFFLLPKKAPPAPQPGEEDKTVIKIIAGGDLNITDRTVAAGQTESGFDYTGVLLDVAPIFAQAQAAVLNFEGTLSGAPYGAFGSAPIQLAQALASCGVDFLQTANSFSVKSGILGLQSTLNAVRSAGMEPLGTFADSSDFAKQQGFTIREIGGIRVAFVAFTKGMDGMGLPSGSEKCVNLLYSDYTTTYKKVNTTGITNVLNNVKAAQPDVTIALLHWGSEGSTTISPTQKKIVKLLQQNGVDAIVGTHSHQVQTIEFNEEKGTVVAYSLGDFLGDGTPYSILLELEITKDNLTGKTAVTGCTPIPIYTVADGANLQVLQIEPAIAQYEENGIGAISAATYASMKSALEQIQKRITPPET